jgi:uncharacterized protein (PEP-CTERM system associated)
MLGLRFLSVILLCLGLSSKESVMAQVVVLPQEVSETEEAAKARNWFFVPSISISGTYSDNIDLAPKGLEKRDFATQVNPAFSTQLERRRLKAKVDYRMQNIFYAENSDFNETYHQYDARADSELLQERFFIEATSALTQRIVDADRRINFNNVSITDNRTNQLTASIRPYIRQDIGSSAEALLRYEYGIVDFDDEKVEGIVSDSTLNNLSLIMRSIPEVERLSWSFNINNQNIDFDKDEFSDLRFTRASLEVDSRVTSTTSLIALGGYEDNDLGANFTSTNTRGAIWEIGARLQPIARSRFEARFGNRYFGDTFDIQLRHEARRVNIALRYKKDIGGLTDYLLRDVSLIDAPLKTPTDNLSLTSEPYVRKRLEGILTFITSLSSKSEFQILLFSEDRQFQLSVDDERRAGVDVSWKWKFLRRTAFTFRTQFGKVNTRVLDLDDEYIRVGGLLERRIGPKTIGSIEIAHTRFKSDNKSNEYDENSIYLALTRSF